MSGRPVMTVHPMVSPRYYGYYLDGFREAFGWGVKLSTRGFPALADPKSGLAAILPEGQRIFIAANDFAHVDPEVVAWADVVGQVNVDPEVERSPKVLPLGPSFGTPWSSAAALATFILRSGVRSSAMRVPAMLRDYLRHQAEREPVEAYEQGSSDPSKVFFLANYWGNAPEANERRLRFVKSVHRVPGLTLEGGFWGGERQMPAEYLPFRLSERVPHADYLSRTQHSAVVFNTPAVHGCLGWKLGEFLALGKAIISTPLGRVMPGRFTAGEHFHLVDDSEEAMVEAVELIVRDHEYRARLEHNARAYWLDYLAPASVARRIVAAELSGIARG